MSNVWCFVYEGLIMNKEASTGRLSEGVKLIFDQKAPCGRSSSRSSSSSSAAARTPAAGGAAPPAGHGAHRGARPPTVALPHALDLAPAPIHAAVTDTILLLAITGLAPALSALLRSAHPTADATITAVALHPPTATPDVTGVLHPDPALAVAPRSTGGEAGSWGGTGAVSPAHPGAPEISEAALAAVNALGPPQSEGKISFT